MTETLMSSAEKLSSAEKTQEFPQINLLSGFH